MNHETIVRTQQLKKKQRIKSRLKKVVMVLACVVVFCTTYALILPALTTPNKAYCGSEEHLHTRECYSRQTALAMTLDCQHHLSMPHVHEAQCYDGQGNLICGKAEFYAHTHEEHCYNGNGELVCKIQERTTHVHSAECYAPLALQEPHVHSEDCYETVTDALLCTLPEETGHSHSEECYLLTDTLACEIEEGHSHGDSCYDENGALLCVAEEGHVHSAGCFHRELQCTLEEAESHSHDESCYSFKQELICGIETDDDSFRAPQSQAVICGQLEAPVHRHSDGCFRVPEQVLTCKLPEDNTHSHTELCYGQWDLICGKEAHTHELICYSNPEADLETEKDWVASLSAVKTTGVWPKDVVAVAVSQLGYTESEDNYTVTESGTTKGYTRYGQWYGDPYGDWCAMFASFCLRYAGVEQVPIHSNCGRWIDALSAEEISLYREAQYYKPLPGDIIFFDWDGDGTCEHVGLVAEVTYGDDGLTLTQVKTIEGNSYNRVQYNTYSANSPVILGYGDINRAYERYRVTHDVERTYSKNGVSVTVTLNADCGIPDEAELVVREVTAKDDSDLYNTTYEDAYKTFAQEISKELPPVIQDLRLFDISFQLDGRRIAPLNQIKIRISYEADGGLYEDYPIYAIHHTTEETVIPVSQSASVEEDLVTAWFETQTMDLCAVASVELQNKDYMSRTDVTAENVGQISGYYALISRGYALALDGMEPVSRKLKTETIGDQAFIPNDSSLELWNFKVVEDNAYYITTDIDGEIYYLSVRNEEGSSPELYLTQEEEERTLWTMDPNDPEVKLMGNGVYMEIAMKGNTKAIVVEPTIGLYRANEFQALFDGQFGAHYYYANQITKYEGASRVVVNCNAQNQVTLLTELESTGVYPYKVVGWYDIVNKVYYGEDKLGTAITLTKDIILYPDYVAETYDIGKNVNVVQGQPRLPFVETHIFDYNEIFNLRSASYTGSIPNITEREASWDFNKWTVNSSSGLGFVFTDWIHGDDGDGNIGRPLSLGVNNSVHNQNRNETEYNAYGMPHFVGGIVPGIWNENLSSALFSHDDYMGRHYIGRADMLYQYDQDTGFYYYNSALNAASYNQSAQRFYVYDYTSGVKNDYSVHDFLPFNYGKSGADEYDDVGSEVNFWFGMTSEITFYLPDEVGSRENVDSNGTDMQFRFSGDDDVWVFIDDQLVLDIGGVHDIAYGEINFATGLAKTAGYNWDGNETYAHNSASPASDYMPGIDGTRGKITTTTLPDLEPGEMHTLTVYYLERGSSLSNCAIYFNLAPMYELEIIKRDAQGLNLLEGAVFQVFEDRECTQLANLMVTDENGNTSHPTEFTTDEAGMILCSGLIAGKTYYIKEVQPPTRPPDHPGYPDMSKYVIQISLGSTGKPTVLVLNSEDEEWVFADAHRFSETGTRVSLTVYNEVGVGGNGKLYVEKVWNEADVLEHDPIIVELLANGKETGRTLTLSQENEWQGFFLELPEVDGDGNEIVYSVKEINAPPGYKVSYTKIESGNSVTTTSNSWEPVTTLESGQKYIFVNSGLALGTGTGDTITMDVSADEALEQEPDGQPYVWTATAAGTGFYLRSGTDGYLTLHDSLSAYFYQTANATTMSVMNFQTDGKLYGLRSNSKYFLRYLEDGYGLAGRQAANGTSFTIYKWTETESTEITDYEGWRITNSPYVEVNTVAIPVRKVWDSNVPADRREPIEVDLYLAPDNGGQATLIRTLTLSEENGWADIFEGLVEPENGYHYYVAERNGGFVVTYNGTTAQIRIGTGANDIITAAQAQPVTNEEIVALWSEVKGTTKGTPAVVAKDSLYFDFSTNQNPLKGWEHTRESLLGDVYGSYVPVYATGGNMVVQYVLNDITIVEYTGETGYVVKPEDHFEISFRLEGTDSMAWATTIKLRITVDGVLREINLGTVQPTAGVVQTFTSGELGLSGHVDTIGFFINGYDIYSDFMYVDYMYLGTNEEPEEPTEPSEDPTEPSEDPTEPSEDPTEPSEDPTEPSEDPTEPSEDPTEPSEDPTEPSEPPDEDIVYNDIVITNKLDTVDIPVEKAWSGIGSEMMNPIVLRLYRVEDQVGENGYTTQVATLVTEVTLSEDTDWKNTFTEVLVPEENTYYVISEKYIPGFQAFYEKETIKITPEDGVPVTGVVVDLNDGQPTTVKVTNQMSSELPATGGEGTHMYTIGGILLISIAALLLVYNSKNNRRKEDRAS